MDCAACHNTERRFFCHSCLSERLHLHRQICSRLKVSIDSVKQSIAQNAATRDRIDRLGQMQQEAHQRRQRLVDVKSQTLALEERIIKERGRVRTLDKAVRQRKRSLDEISKKLQDHIAVETANESSSYFEIQQKLSSTEERTVAAHIIKARRVLVKALLSVFDLRSTDVLVPATTGGEAAPKESAAREYFIHGLMLPSLGDLTTIPREEINGAFGYTAHLVQLLALYLAVHLPYQIIFLGSSSYIRIQYDKADAADTSSALPLYLADDNYDLFMFAIAALNYNVLYLCHLQGVSIPPARFCMTLANMIACCRAADLGKYSTYSLALMRRKHFKYFVRLNDRVFSQSNVGRREADESALHPSLFPHTFTRLFRIIQRRYHHETDNSFGVIEKEHLLARTAMLAKPGPQDKDFAVPTPTSLSSAGTSSSSLPRTQQPATDKMATVFTAMYPFDIDSDDEHAVLQQRGTDDEDDDEKENASYLAAQRRRRTDNISDDMAADFGLDELSSSDYDLSDDNDDPAGSDSFEDLDVSEVREEAAAPRRRTSAMSGGEEWDELAPSVAASVVMFRRPSTHRPRSSRRHQPIYQTDQAAGTTADRVADALSGSINAALRASPSQILSSSSAAVGSTVESVVSWGKGLFSSIAQPPYGNP
ncbi:hypothetical protein RI367_006794 [Sorochytrium milnesiophthora]